MTQVRLTGKTGKGKSRIGQSGAIWHIDESAAKALSPAPEGWLIRSLDGRDWRWVHPVNDPHFTVEIL